MLRFLEPSVTNIIFPKFIVSIVHFVITFGTFLGPSVKIFDTSKNKKRNLSSSAKNLEKESGIKCVKETRGEREKERESIRRTESKIENTYEGKMEEDNKNIA